MVDDTVRLAVDMGRSAIKDQADQLTDLRSRAGTLLAAASIAGTFAGATHGSVDVVAGLALIAYVCCVGACIYVLLPHTLGTEFRGTVLLQTRDEVDASDEEAYTAVVQWLERCAAPTAASYACFSAGTRQRRAHSARRSCCGSSPSPRRLSLHMADENPKPQPRPNPMPMTPPPDFAIPETRDGDRIVVPKETRGSGSAR